MALATQCPHCKTTFRVAQDQLKLRAGLVRCGSCKEIFNGIEHLLATDAAAVQPASSVKIAERMETLSVPQEEKISEPESPLPAPASDALDFAYPEPHFEVNPDEFTDETDAHRQVPEASQNDAETTLAPDKEDPLQRMTLVDFNAAQAPAEPYIAEMEQEEEPVPAPDVPDPLDQVIEELQRKPLRGKKKPLPTARPALPEIHETPSTPEFPEPEEPNFVKQERRKQKKNRALNIGMTLASFMLFAGALGQAAYAFRDQIAARFPEAKPILIASCSFVHCRIDLPAQIETLSIESDELETLNANKSDSVLTMLLRNTSTTVQTWPHIELTLNDENGVMLARRVFAPREYLPSTQEVAKGLPSNSEQAIKLYFEFSAAKPAGYHVGVFYP
jgi:predicted Zn finger-like uncharacterized protein